MAKRQKLNYNSDELALHLKQSTGQGVDALFSPPSPAPPLPTSEGQGQAQRDKRTQVRKRARTHAPGLTETRVSKEDPSRARTHGDMHARIAEELRRGFLDRRHLSSFTFRFKALELEDLDNVTVDVNRGVNQKISKNDVVRLALNWLLRDYQQNKGESVLAKVVGSV